jgi:hypothetical protein
MRLGPQEHRQMVTPANAGRGAAPPSPATRPLTAPAPSIVKGSPRSEKPTVWSRSDLRGPVPARGVLPMGGAPGPSPATAERFPARDAVVCSNRSGRPCDPRVCKDRSGVAASRTRAHGPRCPSSPRECAGASPRRHVSARPRIGHPRPITGAVAEAPGRGSGVHRVPRGGRLHRSSRGSDRGAVLAVAPDRGTGQRRRRLALRTR